MLNESFYVKANAPLIGFVFVVAFFLALRSLGLYPIVFADEYLYSELSRLVPFSDANIPGYLYFAIYRATRLCGDGFLGCARLLNVAFFVCATGFIYLVGKRVVDEKNALLISALSILGPINTYTAYFMPESLYFLCFWIVTWLALSINERHGIWHWFCFGMSLGLTSLVKPHALFLLPALGVLYLTLFSRKVASGESARVFWLLGIFAVGAIATKLLVGFFLAGNAGITAFGSTYNSYASTSIAYSNRYSEFAWMAFKNFRGHLFALAILFAVPSAQLILSSGQFFRSASGCNYALTTAFYTALVLLVLVSVVAIFAVPASGSGPYESINRLSMRYYNFVFPLLLIVGASAISSETGESSVRRRAIIAFPIGAAILYASITHLAPYTPSLVDCPELRGFTSNRNAFYVLSATSVASLALWMYAGKVGGKCFLYLFMPLMVAFSSFHVNQELEQRLIADTFDRAGIFTKQYLSTDDLSKLVVVGPELAGLYRALFHIDNSKATLEAVGKGSAYDLNRMPAGKEWILVIGDVSLVGKSLFQVHGKGFTLAHATDADVAGFGKE
jgi:phosphoglycerol transferase